MVVAKKHHYVPQMYLSGFANAAGQLYAVNAEERKCFRPSPANIAAERDFNTIEAEGVPPDALEKELARLEGEIAPGVKRIRETASFGEDGKDREDVITLIALMALRNPRSRKDLGELYSQLVRAMLLMTFEEKGRWQAWVEEQKKTGQWPQDKPADYEGHKQFVEEHINGLRVHQNFTLEMELDALEDVYHYFDAQDAIAGALDHAAVMRGDGGINQIAPQPSESRQGAILVRAGEPAIASHIRRQDRSKFPGLGHDCPSATSETSTKTHSELASLHPGMSPCGPILFSNSGSGCQALHNHPCRAHCSLRGRGVPSA